MSLTKSFFQIALTTLTFLSCSLHVTAQNVGINFNNSAPNASAALDIDVTALAGVKKGLLIPRVTLLERNAMNPLPAAAPGLMVYQTDGVAGFYYNTSGTVIPVWTQFLNTQSLRWDLLQSATSDLSLSNTDNPKKVVR